VVAALLVASVTSANAALAYSTSSPRATAAEPDTIRVGFTQNVESLNPFSAVLSVEYWMFAHVYDLLVGIGADLEPTPQLANNWSVAADDVTWTFDLYDNVTWHDGEPFSADADD
jgi:peptide/nickel transport system substrate-binding protein